MSIAGIIRLSHELFVSQEVSSFWIDYYLGFFNFFTFRILQMGDLFKLLHINKNSCPGFFQRHLIHFDL